MFHVLSVKVEQAYTGQNKARTVGIVGSTVQISAWDTHARLSRYDNCSTDDETFYVKCIVTLKIIIIILV